LKALCNGGCASEKFELAVSDLPSAVAEIAKRDELHKFAVIPKRWLAEHASAWLDKYRRFGRNCERYSDTLAQLFTMTFVRLIIMRY